MAVETVNMDRILLRLTQGLAGRLNLSRVARLLFVELIGDLPVTSLVLTAARGPALVVAIDSRGKPSSRTENISPIPEPLFERAVAAEQIEVGSSDYFGPDPEADRISGRQSDDLTILTALPRIGKRQKVLAIGLSESVEDSHSLKRLLRASAHLLAVQERLNWADTPGAGDTVPGLTVATDAVKPDRLETIRCLSDGFFHDLTSRLSTISGQTDLIQMHLKRLPQSSLLDMPREGLCRLGAATNKAAETLSSLRSICTLGQEGMRRSISAIEVVRGLPELTAGFARYVRDNKSVTLSIEIGDDTGPDFQLTQGQVFDTVYSLILAIMNEAICGGSIAVSMATGQIPAICIRMYRSILGQWRLADFLQASFPSHVHRPLGAEAGTVRHGPVITTYEKVNTDEYRLMIGLMETSDAPAERTAVDEDTVIIGSDNSGLGGDYER